MPVVIVASLVGLVVVLVAYYRDVSLDDADPVEPDWDVLPAPSDVARIEFPLAVPGYDPAAVELHLDLLTRAYADLLAVAPPDVVARARHRAAVRRGLDPDTVATSTEVGRPRTVLAPRGRDDAEALRTEVALADVPQPADGTDPPGTAAG